MKIGKLFIFALSSFLISAFIFCPERATGSIRAGLFYFSSVLVPSLFPITFMTSFVMKTTLKDLRKGQKSSIFFIFFFSLIGGYVIGAKLISDALREGAITKKQGEMLSLFCVNGGVGFIITAVGTGIFGSQKAGLLLYASGALYSVLGFLVFLPKISKGGGFCGAAYQKPISVVFCETVAETAQVLINIAGFVILFSAVNSYLSGTKLAFLTDFFEITTAVNDDHSLPYLSMLLGFGGVSVILQILSVMKGAVRIKPFLISRLLHAGFSFAFTYVFIKIFKISLPVAALQKAVVMPYYDRFCVSLFAVVSMIMLILSLEGKNRGGNLREDLLQ